MLLGLEPLNVFFTGMSIITLVWGIERYRTQFVKSDLLISFSIAIGMSVLAYGKKVLDVLKDLFAVERTFVLASLITNGVLLLVIFYILSQLRNVTSDVEKMGRKLSIDKADVDSSAEMADGGRIEKVIKIVIPAYNEEQTIESVVSSLPESIRGYRISPVIVSDGSVDQTAKKAKSEHSVVVEHPVNQGQGAALKTGFEIAKRDGAEIVVTMDGDGQHPVEELERIVTPIINGEAEFVMGSRYLGTDHSENGTLRTTGISFFTWFINILTKSSITDCTNGYRAIRAKDLQDFTLTEERFSAPELIIEARKHGLRIKELPITVEERKSGETKKPQLGYALGLTQTILTTWLR